MFSPNRAPARHVHRWSFFACLQPFVVDVYEVVEFAEGGRSLSPTGVCSFFSELAEIRPA